MPYMELLPYIYGGASHNVSKPDFAISEWSVHPIFAEVFYWVTVKTNPHMAQAKYQRVRESALALLPRQPIPTHMAHI